MPPHPSTPSRLGKLGKLGLLLPLLLGSAGFETCGPQFSLENNGFDLWCGERLCSWEVEEGSIARVPTWHEQDYGVDLIGPRVVLSQLHDTIDFDLRCIEIDTLSDVAPNTTLQLQIDVDDDGTIDGGGFLAAQDWGRGFHRATFDDSVDRIRFLVVKEGPGPARLAQVRAHECR